jgi:hypothetical protein
VVLLQQLAARQVLVPVVLLQLVVGPMVLVALLPVERQRVLLAMQLMRLQFVMLFKLVML